MLSLLLVIIMLFLMMCNSTSSSRLWLTVQTQFALHPCDPFLRNNRNMTGNSVQKHGFVLRNVKLQVKLRFKTFYWLLKLLYTAFAWNTATSGLFCSKFWHILCNKRVIYGPERNLYNHELLKKRLLCLSTHQRSVLVMLQTKMQIYFKEMQQRIHNSFCYNG